MIRIIKVKMSFTYFYRDEEINKETLIRNVLSKKKSLLFIEVVEGDSILLTCYVPVVSEGQLEHDLSYIEKAQLPY